MTIGKVVFWFWGFVYWPFMLLGLLFLGLANLFYAVGGWLHDLLLDLAYPLPTVYVRNSEAAHD